MTRGGAVVAIDQGGQSTRAVVFDRDGTIRSQAQIAVATRRPAADRVEHDADELVRSVESALIGAGVTTDNVIAAGLATQRSSLACWDSVTGAALAPVLSWQDRRAASLLAELSPDAATVRRLTGLVPSPHYGASKLRWCLDNLDPVRRAARSGRLTVGPLSSFLSQRLTGRGDALADPANASRTLLWELARRDWSPTLLTAFGIAPQLLPRCVPNRYAFGRLHGSGVELQVCTGDQGAALFAHGPVDTRRIYVNIGTGAFVLAPLDGAAGDTPLLRSIVWDDGQHAVHALEGTVNGAASALAAMAPRSSRADIATAAQRIGCDDELPLFLNGVSGLGSPLWCELPSRFIGDGDARDRITAVLESILFLLQLNLEQVPDLGARSVLISGGLANHDGLCAGLASLGGIAVVRAKDPEATARGLAWLVAGSPPDWPRPQTDTFAVHRMPALQHRFRRWREVLLEALDADDAATPAGAP